MKKSAVITLFALLVLFIDTASPAEVTMFGPKRYLRTTGAPNVYTDTFSATPKEGRLIIKNGDENGKHRVSSALIFVNGEQVIGPKDFNQRTGILEVPVNLSGDNSILVELRSKPGSYLTIEVIQDIPLPTVNISAVPDTIHINETSTLSWISTNADSATIDQGIGDVDVNGSITVSPTETTIYTITVTNLGGTDTATVTVTVVNTAPVANPQPVTTDEDTAVLITLTASDVDGDPLTYQVTTGPPNGTLSGTAPALTYTPAADWYGTDAFTFTVNDGTVGSTPATVTITVNPVNDVPAPVNDDAATDEDTAVITGNVLANDMDADGDILSVSGFTQPANGTAIYNGGGTFTYTPNANYNGTDSFIYTADDGNGESAPATVTVTVAPVNDPPEILPIDDHVMDEDTTLQVPISSSDPDGDPLTLSITGLPSFANFTDNGDGTGSISFDAGCEDAGIYSMSVTASDTELTTSDEFVLTVNDVAAGPVITSSPVITGAEYKPYLYDVEATDPGGYALTYSLTVYPSGMTINSLSGRIEWTPNQVQVGDHDVTVHVENTQGLYATQQFIISVANVNTINWVNWTQQTASNNVIGNISFPVSQRVDVNYHGTIRSVQTSGGRNWWLEYSPPPYTGNEVVTNAPPASDIIQIKYSGVTNKITFSRPVINPVMAFVSIGNYSCGVDYNFNTPFVLLSEGRGWWGDGWWKKNGNTLTGYEAHGVIQFIGVISEISWTNYPYEDWHGFTIGIPEEFNSPLPEFPIANAGLNQDVFIGDTVFLDGTASNDPYGSPITYHWTMTDIPDGSSAFLSDTLSSTPSFIADKTGTYVIQLIVNNGTWDSPVDIVEIHASVPMVTVPDVINSPQSAAEAAITAAQLVVGNITEEHSSIIPEGSIISQSPVAGSSVPINSSVNLVVSLGVEMVTVPDVVGMARTAAETTLTSSSLSVGTVTEQVSNTVPAGNVISQSPIAGSSVPINSSVNLVVSLGVEMVTVPNVAGMASTAAETTLASSSLLVGAITGQYSDTVPAGNVISQSPAAGTSVPINSSVNLVVSLGVEMVTVPNVVGMAGAAAETTLASSSLLVGTITEQYSDTVPAGDVISQSPAAGTSVPINSSVNLVVSLGVEMVTVPNVVGMAGAAAEAAITSVGLTVGNITGEYIDTVPEGDVMAQSPEPGTTVVAGSQVNIHVSWGVWTGVDEDPPTVSISVDRDPVSLGETVIITVLATDNAGVVTETLTVNGTVLSLIGDEAVYVADTAGPILAEAVATDAAGLSDSAHLTFVVIDPADTSPPVVSLYDEDCVDVTDRYTITGSVSDDTGTFWKLQSREKGAEAWTTFAEGFTSSLMGDLGVFDPTVLRNGVHEIRIYAEDTNNNTAAVEGCMVVDGELKVGQVIIPVEDINIPQMGFPLSIVREYDSRAGGEGDFGPGWNLSSSDVKPTATTPLGENWDEYATGVIIPTYYLYGITRHEVVIRFSDSDILKFKLTPSPESSVLYPFNCYMPLTISFVPMDDTQGTLEALDFDPNAMFCNGRLIDLSGALYDPKKFRLTRVDGTQYVISENGIESMTDPYGHTITYGENGITHSSGASLSFSRGEGNRIETITDQFGGVVEYHYDEDGYLSEVVQTSVSGAINMISQYAYATGVFEKPVLKAITAPDGTELGQFEYDSSGRMTALIDANGNRIIYGHDVPNHQQVITDRLGNDTLYEYDNKGNVTTKIDPMGYVTQWTYDENGHKLTETDPLGNTTNYTHDPYGNLLTETDPLGNTTTYTYNDMNQVLTTTDARGNTTTKTYDANGNMISETDPEGGITTHTYDANGNLASTTDALGNTTTYTYVANGNMISETDPLGNTTAYTYDGYGNKLTQTVTRTTGSGPVSMTTTYEYDALDRLIRETDPDDYYVEMWYNDIDKMTARVDKNSNLTEYGYDSQGNKTRITYADGTTESFTYDAEGNRLTFTDRAGRTTGYDYDLLNRLIGTIYPDRSFKAMEYEAAGRLIATIDENVNRTEFGYDAAGRRTSVTDALGNITTFAYDANGNQVSMTDANGNTTAYEYDGLNQRIRTIYPDGTFSTVAYDALGRKVSETDQAGNTTLFEYDAMGRLTMVTDALGAETRYAYDEVGNKVSQTDPNGNITLWAYDNLGRVVTHTLPLGMFETFTYDANGNMLTKTDFNGDTTTYEHDVCCGRLLRKIYPDASEVSFTYTATSQRETVTDSRGLTTYTYDLRDRVLSVLNPNGSALSYTYDAAGNRTSVTTPVGTTSYTFDALNRLETVTDPDGNITTYSYDAVGNRTSILYPNGTVTSYQYDILNRLAYLENRKFTSEIISSYTYTLGPAGNRFQVVENTGRVVNYTYDATYKLTQEAITDAVIGNETITYTYDPFGNRLTKTDSLGTVTYTYDVNDRLTTETGSGYTYSYTYDANGNTLSRSDGSSIINYYYDYENRLVQFQNGGSQADYAYDTDGIRVWSNTDGTITDYLVDKNRDYAQVLEERNGSGSLTVDYVYGDDLISQHRVGGAYFYLYDGQMSTRQLIDATEGVANEYTYDAFGIVLDQAGVVENNYMYTGEQFDPNAGFYYLRARYYNQNVGKFMTTDPWEGDTFDPVTLHKYLYAGANPITHIDPTGMFSIVEVNTALAIMFDFYLETGLTTVAIASHINLYKVGFKFREKGMAIIASPVSNEELDRIAFESFLFSQYIFNKALHIQEVGDTGFSLLSKARSGYSILTSLGDLFTRGLPVRIIKTRSSKVIATKAYEAAYRYQDLMKKLHRGGGAAGTGATGRIYLVKDVRRFEVDMDELITGLLSLSTSVRDLM